MLVAKYYELLRRFLWEAYKLVAESRSAGD